MAADTATDVPAGQIATGRRGLIIAGLLACMLLAALDQTIVSTALPTIVADLGGAAHLSWVVTAYLLASTASTPLWGKLGDLFGRKVLLQVAVVIFLVGSALAGLSQDMLMLVALRAVQGLGGGGLMVLSQATVGDVVPPRERGRYQGIFGAVFGASSVIGPLLGGFFVDNLSWHWVFYINLPVGGLALLITAIALPGHLTHGRPAIDYLGIVLVAGAAVALVLFTSWGGTVYPWSSPQVIGAAAAGVVLAVAFVFAERRAVEPVLPLRLFRIRVFAVASVIGFVVGFAMFGAITYLPIYLQVVTGVGATESGLRMLPMMAGVLLTSIGSGQVISHTGRYKAFPIAGTAVMTVGLYLLSRLGVGTGFWYQALAMFVLGAGLGLVIQVLVLAVQNAADYRDLGAATSGATFFRQVGGSFGVSIFGAIFASALTGNLTRYVSGGQLPPTVASETSRSAWGPLPARVLSEVLHAYAASIHTVFLWAIPVAAVAFLVTFLLPEVTLRATSRATDPGGTPCARGSWEEIERALTVLVHREDAIKVYRWLSERAELGVSPGACWLLSWLSRHPDTPPGALPRREVVDAARRTEWLSELSDAGLVRVGGTVVLTADGQDAVERLADARCHGLEQLCDGWQPELHPELRERLTVLARNLLGSEPAMPRG